MQEETVRVVVSDTFILTGHKEADEHTKKHLSDHDSNAHSKKNRCYLINRP